MSATYTQSHESCACTTQADPLSAAIINAPCAVTKSGLAMTRPALPASDMKHQLENVVAAVQGVVERIETFVIEPHDLPWQQHLGVLQQGQQVTFFVDGLWWFSSSAGRWLEPGFVFFARINGAAGTTPIANLMQNTGTLTADHEGRLEIARSVGEFASPAGDLWVPEEHYLASEGHLEGVAIVWQTDAKTGLQALATAGDVNGLIAAELNRLRLLERMPAGWHNFFQFGDGSIYQDLQLNAESAIDCYTHKNVGILQYPLAAQVLQPGLTLNWRWLVDQLPSDLPEDQLLNHDYLSIALQFDDGQDITWMWSSQLPEGKVFRCPIPGWDQVETHVVQRSGLQMLGQEVSEQVDVFEAYQSIIGGTASRVVHVWLIANSLFLRRHGRCYYRDIRIGQLGQQQQIL